jgi:2-haloacid dehalogenase
VVFDAYGTLFDPQALSVPLEQAFHGRGDELAAAWRATQLRHTWLRSLMGDWLDFDGITRQALRQVLAAEGDTSAGAPNAGRGAQAGAPRDRPHAGAPNAGDRAHAGAPNAGNDARTEAGRGAEDSLADALLLAYRRLPAYPDAGPALAALEPDRPRAILTNGTRTTVEATVRAAGLATDLPTVLSVEEVRVYKPAPAVYAMASDHFAVEPAAVTFVSGNAWDCAGAGAFGLRVVRIRRSTEAAEAIGPEPIATIDDLRELTEVLRR